MINTFDILETIKMIQDECLDIRTTTMGISLLDCADSNIDKACDKVYDKICQKAEKLVSTGEDIEKQYGIPIINKRVSVTPIAILAGISGGDPVKYALALEKAAQTIGVNFIGGYSALVQKGFSAGDLELINSIPEALARTEHLCSSVNIGSTKAGINMDAVKIMGQKVKEAAELTKDNDCIGAGKLVVFMEAFRVRVLLEQLFQNTLITVLMRLPSLSKKLHLRLQEWVSWLVLRLLKDLVSRLV